MILIDYFYRVSYDYWVTFSRWCETAADPGMSDSLMNYFREVNQVCCLRKEKNGESLPYFAHV